MCSFWFALQIGYNFGVHFVLQGECRNGVFPCLHENSGHESFEYLTRVKVLTDSLLHRSQPNTNPKIWQICSKYNYHLQSLCTKYKSWNMAKYHSRLMRVEHCHRNWKRKWSRWGRAKSKQKYFHPPKVWELPPMGKCLGLNKPERWNSLVEGYVRSLVILLILVGFSSF